MNALIKFIYRLFFGESDNIERFRERVKLSLRELECNSPDCSNRELLETLQAKGIPRDTANLIIENLSSSFCKKLMNELKWKPNDPNYPLENLINSDNQSISDEKRIVVEEEMEAYYQDNPNSTLIISLASRSFGLVMITDD